VKSLPLAIGLVLLAGCSAPQEAPLQSPAPEPTAAMPVETLQVAYEKAATAYEAEKTDPTKSAYIDATVAYATEVMAADGPPSKYQKSLKLYDEALRLDPDNEEAKTNRQLIIDVYHSMGKEPPK
jgi:tetratricopeptide (TPR) repeat protein